MPNFTPKLDLIKPLGTENFNVSHANGNADKIDEAYGNIEEKVNDLISRTINVKDLGAKGDYDWQTGLGTDDTQAIMDAIIQAGSDNEVVLSNGVFYVTSTLSYKNHSKIKFDGAIIVTDSNFVGEALLHCNSSSIYDGKGNGYLLNADLRTATGGTDAMALKLEGLASYRVEGFKSEGYKKGGIRHLSGYELMLSDFNIKLGKIKTRDLESLVAGIFISTSDSECTNGAVNGYPVGVRVGAGANNFVNVHCWGIPSTGSANDERIMKYPFFITGLKNNFTNCYADTPDVLDTSQPVGGNNGGIGFFEVDSTLISSSYPSRNNYDGCRVSVHDASQQNKMIGFRLGDDVLLSGNNYISIYTSILNPQFTGTYSEEIKILNYNRIRSTISVLSNILYSDLGVQNSVTTNKINIVHSSASTTAVISPVFVTKYYKSIILNNAWQKIFNNEEINYFCIDKISIASATAGAQSGLLAKTIMTSDGTINDTSTFAASSALLNVEHQVAVIKWWNNTVGSPIRVSRRSDGWFIKCDDNFNRVVLLEMTLNFTN